jgi:hypothetical protein
VVARLREARAYWLATSGSGGRPHVVPVWGVLVADDLYLEVGDPATAKSRHLATDTRVVVHLDDVDDVVVVHGDAAFVRPTGALAADLSTAFRAKYPGYLPGPDEWDGGTLVRVDPDTVLAWRDMPTATRWRFTR